MHISEMIGELHGPLTNVQTGGDKLLGALQDAYKFASTNYDDIYDTKALKDAVLDSAWTVDPNVYKAIVRLNQNSNFDACVYLAAAIVVRANEADTAYC